MKLAGALLAAVFAGTALAGATVSLPNGADCKIAYEADTSQFWPFELCDIESHRTNSYCCFYSQPGVRRNMTYVGSCEDEDVTSYDTKAVCYKFGK